MDTAGFYCLYGNCQEQVTSATPHSYFVKNQPASTRYNLQLLQGAEKVEQE